MRIPGFITGVLLAALGLYVHQTAPTPGGTSSSDVQLLGMVLMGAGVVIAVAAALAFNRATKPRQVSRRHVDESGNVSQDDVVVG